MTDKPNLTLIHTTPLTDLPKESLEDFKGWVLIDGLAPSAALRKMMEKYDCPKPDSSVPIRMIELTFPEIDISRGNFTFKITDSGYPNGNLEQFSDADFDAAVEELRNMEPGW